MAAHWWTHWHYNWQLSPKALRLQLTSNTHMKPCQVPTLIYLHTLFCYRASFTAALFIRKSSILARLGTWALYLPCAHGQCVSVYINTAGGDRTGRGASVGNFIKTNPIWSFGEEHAFIALVQVLGLCWPLSVKRLARCPTLIWGSKTFCSRKD